MSNEEVLSHVEELEDENPVTDFNEFDEEGPETLLTQTTVPVGRPQVLGRESSAPEATMKITITVTLMTGNGQDEGGDAN